LFTIAELLCDVVETRTARLPLMRIRNAAAWLGTDVSHLCDERQHIVCVVMNAQHRQRNQALIAR
jgi:hypothetical protein